MRLLSLDGIEDGCVYEFAYEYHGRPEDHWREAHGYLPWEEFGLLSQVLHQIIPNYNDYGPEKLTLDQWGWVEAQCLARAPEERAFFESVRRWLDRSDQGAESFWILGP